mmetsp:Transcript_10505/g.31594  ORF Transcript_10505/g.31594 Transcript_10505/m.31594 type:complete len:245 (+) Transcript_10505:844-1578(+)
MWECRILDYDVTLWLWFEAAVGLALVDVVLSILLLALRSGAPAGPVGLAGALGLATLVAARYAHGYRFTAGWVDVDDEGWGALRKEAAAARGQRTAEPPELGVPPTAAEVGAARVKSFEAHAPRLLAVTVVSAVAWTALAVAVAAGAATTRSWSAPFCLWVATAAGLAVSASTLPLFARAHTCASALALVDPRSGTARCMRYVFVVSRPAWALCAAATAAGRVLLAAGFALAGWCRSGGVGSSR